MVIVEIKRSSTAINQLLGMHKVCQFVRSLQHPSLIHFRVVGGISSEPGQLRKGTDQQDILLHTQLGKKGSKNRLTCLFLKTSKTDCRQAGREFMWKSTGSKRQDGRQTISRCSCLKDECQLDQLLKIDCIPISSVALVSSAIRG
jgi:hypothetical protein